MKANELMIGDIVCFKRNKEYFRIWEIDDYRGVINNEPDGYYSETNINIDEIEPIQLTDDILTANGFEYMCDEQIEYYNDKCVPHIHLRVCQYSPLELDWDGNWVLIHYVHQLQHILRLCGLKELANNLKISNNYGK